MTNRKTPCSTFTCEPALRAMIDDCATQEDRNFSSMVRILLKEALKNRGFDYKGD
jgi:hypothetical protein